MAELSIGTWILAGHTDMYVVCAPETWILGGHTDMYVVYAPDWYLCQYATGVLHANAQTVFEDLHWFGHAVQTCCRLECMRSRPEAE